MKETIQQRGRQWLEELVQKMGLNATVRITASEGWLESESCWLTIDSSLLSDEQIEMAIGSGGERLDAVQYLTNAILNLGQNAEEQGSFTVELHGYRQQRQQELQKMAEAAAQSVRQTGVEYEMNALSSAERRQVHQFLQAYEDLETESRGKEPHRRLIVRRLPQ
ncbi:protein jag [Roseofilum casamattae]|uniref:RNA-binding protein n=1 Tax=Roseofilum casamattae BLCC-M143 TaxID=3022442 RepID=A0ABT7C173_9CYAN|nr:R3H domain-containing nucleic acid-binding protein [Roseofilum casamattae]MDJ1185207.1 RNA-binding protein [Roseofilum casamattae BLCC-M143]